jgi:hypothetical protein
MKISGKDGKRALKPQGIWACTDSPIAGVFIARKNGIIIRKRRPGLDKTGPQKHKDFFFVPLWSKLSCGNFHKKSDRRAPPNKI